MKLKDAVERRADEKKFDFKKPDWRKVVRAIDLARFAPAAGNYYSSRFIIVTDEKVIKKLSDASQQPFVGQAKMVVVVVSDKTGLVRAYADRGEAYSRQHVGAAIQNFLLGLEQEKLITSWVWYFVDDQVKSALDIPSKMQVEGIFPVGKKAKVRGKRNKRNARLETILFFEKYGEKRMDPPIKNTRETH
jgi:nitroreductase